MRLDSRGARAAGLLSWRPLMGKIIRCGNSQTLHSSLPPDADRCGESPPSRFSTPLHLLSRESDIQRFRVMARLPDGNTALVSLGDTREEALKRARANAAGRAVRFWLEAWSGGTLVGGWGRLPCRRHELPPVARNNRPRHQIREFLAGIRATSRRAQTEREGS